ncbi:MAG TPA: GNAT family protein [Ktedonobacteraceae bacterium]|nr:GNAT family protein [Ktedonobacteraceae bacterium]
MDQTEADLHGDRPVLNFSGEKVALGPVQKSMIPDFFKWENDFAVTLMSGDSFRPVSQELIEMHFERRHKDDNPRHVEFAIYERASMRLIGNVHLRDIDKDRRTARYGIMIGEKDCWGKGYGTEVTILMLDYAFTILGLHNILLSTYAYNERAVRAYTRAGFRVMGRQREATRLGNQVYDIIFMDCLASEFRSPLKRIIDLP